MADLLVYPEVLTPELDEVLGWTLMKCAQYADLFRMAGHVIPPKVEREQAFIHHWLIKLVLAHGAEWKTFAVKDLDAIKAQVEAKQREGGQDNA
jgi:hypothetical protein